MEGLQSVLKQRDGEVQQLQWEIHRLQTERNFLSNEISNLTIELEKVKFDGFFWQNLFIKILLHSNFRLQSKSK
jgi:TATA element modulatory factor 1 TATA binding